MKITEPERTILNYLPTIIMVGLITSMINTKPRQKGKLDRLKQSLIT